MEIRTVSEMLFAEEDTYGADISIPELPEGIRTDAVLFGESQGRIVIACAKDKADGIITSAEAAGVPAQLLGHANGGNDLKVDAGGSHLTWDASTLRQAWENAIPDLLDE